MASPQRTVVIAGTLCLASSLAAAGGQRSSVSAEVEHALPAAGSPSQALVAAIADPALRTLLDEVLTRNPRLAALSAAARAAEQRAPQARALPDPMVGVTAFVLPPETRTGPQRASLGLSQRLPWFGKLKLKEKAALYEALAALARVESARLDALTEARRLYYELAFASLRRELVRQDRETLGHFEELARTRYATGVGLEQAVVKIQAEIARADVTLIEIASLEARLLAELDALRDRPDAGLFRGPDLPHYPARALDATWLREQAYAHRPELSAARATVASGEARVALARRQYRPDLTAGLSYTVVERRDDRAGRMNPPQGNGNDILALTGGVNLPLWRGALAAGVEEAIELELAAEESLRAAFSDIDRDLAELESRLPLLEDQLRLFEDVLLVQAEESLHSALAGYGAGVGGALDLLDAERVRLQVQVAAARARADHAIAIARLERAIARPVSRGEES